MKQAALITVALSCLTATAAYAQSAADDGANLGQSTDIVPPLPAPQPSETAQGEAPPRADLPTVPLDEARRHWERGRYELAVRAASRGIARDEENADEYRRIRAQAYALSGRFEEALADAKPLPLTVTAARAELKSGNDVVTVVEKGTKLSITEVRGDWLKVASADGETFDWAWIRTGNVRQPVAPLAGERDGRRDIDPRATPGIRVYVDRGYPYHPRYYRERPPVYFPPSPYAPYDDYGRLHYDWWQHVPPRYWKYLPR